MEREECVSVLRYLKEKYERIWGVFGISLEADIAQHAKLSYESEEFWRQKYIEALSTAISLLDESGVDFIHRESAT